MIGREQGFRHPGAGSEHIEVPLGELGRDDLSLGGLITLSEFMSSIFAEIVLRLKAGDTGNNALVYSSSLRLHCTHHSLVTWGVTISTVVVTSIFMYSILSNSTPAPPPSKEEDEPPIELRDFTIDQLREFDGTDDKKIYIAMKGDVFDVTKAKHMYGPQGSYSCFAGREASRAMAKMSFEESDLINHDTSDLNAFERSILDDWHDKFKYQRGYPIVGRASVPPQGLTFTREQLLNYRGKGEVPPGRIDAPIYVSVCGDVFDVSYGGKDMYSEESPYFIFTGIDASRALAKMSFKPEDLQNSDLSDLSDSERKVLQDWHAKFAQSRKYPIVGRLV